MLRCFLLNVRLKRRLTLSATYAFLLICVSVSSTVGLQLKCSVAKPVQPDPYYPHCCYPTEARRDPTLANVNNSTGLISFDVPINPSGPCSAKRIKYTVTLFHCAKNQSGNVSSGCENGDAHQKHSFYSRGIDCTDSSNVTLLFYNVWTDNYQLSVKRGSAVQLVKPFSVVTNFTKPPRINSSNIYFQLTKTESREVYATFGTTVEFGPPIRQLELLIFNRPAGCDSLTSAASVYLDTTLVDEYCEGVRSDCSVKCDTLGSVTCVASSETQIKCLFTDISVSNNYTGLARFSKDVLCTHPAYGNLNSDSCCVRNKVETLIATNRSPLERPEQKGDLNILFVILFLAALVIILVGTVYCHNRHHYRQLRPRYRHDSSMELNARLPETKPSVLLLYAREPGAFLTAMASLHRVLSYYCQVVDVFGPDVEAQVLSLSPARWLTQRLTDESLRVVLVVTPYAVNTLTATESYNDPLDHVFTLAYNSLSNQRVCDGRVSVVTLAERLQLPVLLATYTFHLPQQLHRLVNALLRCSDLPVPQVCRLGEDINNYHHSVTDKLD